MSISTTTPRGSNTIGAFDRHADGSLSPLAGSPFAAGGAGTGAGLASQGALQLSSDGRYLIAVDAGSNQISVLRIRPDGSLKLVPGGVVSSGGPTPVSVAVHDNLVYVANAGAVGPNYTGFTLNRGGHLRPLAELNGRPARRLPAWRRSLQLDRHQPGRHPRRHVGNRQFPRRQKWVADRRRRRLSLRRSGARTVRQRVPTDRLPPAVRF